MTPSQRRPASRARGSTRSSPLSDSSIERLTFLRLWVSLADRKTLISSKRSRSSSACSNPRSFGMRTERETSPGSQAARSTSRAAASCGITWGRTKLVRSMRRSPLRPSSSISRTFSSVGTTSGSFWKPSRGPTSRIRTCWTDVLTARSLESRRMVVALAGGTGGAKLARGLQAEIGDELAVIANTGDDCEFYEGHVSPDPDLVTFWLADRIDERGWGLRGDTFAVMDGLRELGEDVWFNLGDRDLALCLRRARRLAEGARLTETIDEARRALGIGARVVVPTDDPVRTQVRAGGRWHGFQEFMIR